jgi:dephospho-CoA kinase
MTHRVVAIVGMPGAGKSELASFLRSKGFVLVHFGDATADELARRGLRVSEANERVVREELRALHGMAAYAILNLPRIEAALASSHVVVDGLYSWEEYLVLKEKYGNRLVTVAVTASPATRQKRLASRAVRPLSAGEVAGRDRAEIEKINKGGPIAMADITLVNEGTLPELLERAGSILEAIR